MISLDMKPQNKFPTQVAQPSSAAGSSAVPVLEGNGGETPPEPAGEDACATQRIVFLVIFGASSHCIALSR
jgi:hypothetical protein